jgi:hypothetical protein
MNPVIVTLAKELAAQLNHVINLPFINEEEEEVFFKLVVTKVLELAFGHLIKLVDSPQKAEL